MKKFAWLLCLLLALGTGSVFAQAAPSPKDVDTALDTARKQIDQIQKTLKEAQNDTELVHLRSMALDVQSKANASVESLDPQLAGVTARLGELGLAEPGTHEAPDVAAQRKQLEKNRGALDAQIKLGRLLALESGQAVDTIAQLRRSQLQASFGERRPSVLSASFWQDLHSDWAGDAEQLASLPRALAAALGQTRASVWWQLGLAIAALLALRMWLGRRLFKQTASRVPSGRLRRSLCALALVILGSLTPGIIAYLLYFGIDWSMALDEDMAAWLWELTGTISFGGFVASLGSALLSPDHPSWRLPRLADRVALRMRYFPLMLAIVIVFVWIAERLPALLNTSLSFAIAVNCAVALALSLTLGFALRRAERARRRDAATAGDDVPPRPLWVVALVVTAWTVLSVAVLSILAGYVVIGTFVVKQMVWALVVLSAAYLLAVLLDDIFDALRGAIRSADAGGGVEPRLLDQACVLLAGLCRVGVVLFALLLLWVPFGEGPVELLLRASLLHNGLTVGEVRIRPGIVLQALFVLALSLAGVKVFKNWLRESYLPTTSLEPGMQLSATTLFGYAGGVLAIALSLSAAGIGLERVAWIVSALSVGIGFGLQGVVQNFISGLILLAERPVKVGDWVSLSGVEGDILRINVRATEIQMGDRSTLIVPNSEFITKVVRNVTHSNPLGVLQIKLPMPLNTDAARVHDILLAAMIEHEDVLDAPEPKVFLEGVVNDSLVFHASACVASPRAVYAVRSKLWFIMLRQLSEANLDMYRPATFTLAPDAGAIAATGMASTAASDPIKS